MALGVQQSLIEQVGQDTAVRRGSWRQLLDEFERAADVALKEGRPLVVVPREAPLSEIHLENMLRLARLGAAIVPASPGFYHGPKTIDDLVHHVVGKVLDRIGVEHKGVRWSGELEPPREPGTERADGAETER